ncbi:cytochrome P450 [Auriculariales sp. MPI-PUGE-AT-0066]|nr:cytochrome P450 [Auriculariales sp. MPI-PUGE-AT-0066]
MSAPLDLLEKLRSNGFLTAGATVGTVVAVYAASRLFKQSASLGHSLPGPPGKFLLGNMMDLPQPGQKEWMVYGALADKYGPVIGLNVMGTYIVVLDRAEDVKQLFAIRNTIYSNKPRMTMVEMVGWDVAVGLVQPGEKFRAERRLMNKMMGSQTVHNILTVHREGVPDLVRRLTVREGDFSKGLSGSIAHIFLRILWGYRPHGDNDALVKLANDAVDIFFKTHDNWLVNILPSLKHVPEWFPGAQFKRTAREWKDVIHRTLTYPLGWVEEQIRLGKAEPSFARDYMALVASSEEERTMFREILGSLYAAGTDTMSNTVHWLLVALALHPDIQKRAQEEVDKITQNGHRLPTYEDRPKMPYVSAIVSESYRWMPALNLALPHILTQDDEYNGYHIPKGALCWANTWRILHNPQKYPEPSRFNPERYLTRDVQDKDGYSINPELINENPFHYAFGYGLRICPGRHLADATVFLTAATVLATCNVSNPVDKDGKPLTLETIDQSPGLIAISNVKGLTVDFRSAHADALIAGAQAAKEVKH